MTAGGTSAAERRIFLNRFPVQEAMQHALEDDLSLERPDRVITPEQVGAALHWIARLCEFALPLRPALAQGIGGYGLDASSTLLAALRIVYDAEHGRVEISATAWKRPDPCFACRRRSCSPGKTPNPSLRSPSNPTTATLTLERMQINQKEMSSMTDEMLIAVRSGVTFNWDGSVVEFTAGRTRIAPELLTECPQFEQFFERDFTAPGTDASRSVIRTMMPTSGA